MFKKLFVLVGLVVVALGLMAIRGKNPCNGLWFDLHPKLKAECEHNVKFIDKRSETSLNSECVEIYHRVQKGETIYSIANIYGMSAGQIMELNHMTSILLRLGQTLKITDCPEPTTEPYPEPEPEVTLPPYP